MLAYIFTLGLVISTTANVFPNRQLIFRDSHPDHAQSEAEGLRLITRVGMGILLRTLETLPSLVRNMWKPDRPNE